MRRRWWEAAPETASPPRARKVTTVADRPYRWLRRGLRRLRLCGRYTWRFLRTGDERFMDVAVLALTATEYQVLAKGFTLAILRTNETLAAALLPALKKANEAMLRLNRAWAAALEASQVRT